jgi:hypothetical protein
MQEYCRMMASVLIPVCTKSLGPICNWYSQPAIPLHNCNDQRAGNTWGSSQASSRNAVGPKSIFGGQSRRKDSPTARLTASIKFSNLLLQSRDFDISDSSSKRLSCGAGQVLDLWNIQQEPRHVSEILRFWASTGRGFYHLQISCSYLTIHDIILVKIAHCLAVVLVKSIILMLVVHGRLNFVEHFLILEIEGVRMFYKACKLYNQGSWILHCLLGSCL